MSGKGSENEKSDKGRDGILGRTVIKRCSCTSKFQDKTYGRQMRVFNVGKDASYCTSCGGRDRQ